MNKKPSGLKQPSRIARPSTSLTGRSSTASSRAPSPTNTDSGALTENTDDFIVGDRIYVGGTKPGYIQFIGETKFAPGEWAGIVLDEASGKNDGSVNGIRYFMCEPKRGVFSRLAKLTRDPVGSGSVTRRVITPKSSITPDNDDLPPRRVSTPTNGSVGVSTASRRSTSPTEGVTKTTKQTKRVTASPNTGGQVLTTTTTTTVKHDALPASSGTVRIGDRVLVSGTKAGVLRYLGTTDFADGEWCGVELDEPLGKNDGTVAGQKYFDCKMKYGLFAPVSKVTKQPGSSTVTRVVRTTRVASNSPTPSLHKRSGSRESLGSMSTTSQRSTPGSRVRLGVTSLTSAGQKSSRPQAANVSATNTALQEMLREKEQHIDQLLKERDMERSEVARAAAQVDSAESQLAALQAEYDRLSKETSTKIESLTFDLENENQQRKELVSQLEDEKRKVEDLEFQLDEEALSKGDDEPLSTSERTKFQELEVELEKEKQKNANLENSSAQASPDEEKINYLELKRTLEEERLKSSQMEDSCTNLKSQLSEMALNEDERKRQVLEIDSLRLQLEEAHGKIVSLEMAAKGGNRHSPSKMSSLEKEIATRDDNILQLQASLEHKKKEASDLQARMAEMERELDTTKKRNQRQQEIIDNMQRKLTASQEKCDGIMQQKTKLEEQLFELMSSAADNNPQELGEMNETIKNKDQQIENLNTQLQDAILEKEKAKDVVNHIKEQSKKEMSNLEGKFSQEKQIFIDKLKSMDEELQEANKKLSLTCQSQTDELARRTLDLENVRINLEKKESECMQLNVRLQEVELKADCSADQLKRAQTELVAAKQRFDDMRTDLGAEKEAVLTQLSNVEADKVMGCRQLEKMNSKYDASEKKVKDLQSQVSNLSKQNEDQKFEMDSKDARMAALKSEVGRLNSEFNAHREELQRKLKEQRIESGAMNDLKDKLQQYHKQMQQVQDDFVSCEKQNQELSAEIQRLSEYETQKTELDAECMMLKKELEILKDRERKSSSDLKKDYGTMQEKLIASQSIIDQKQNEIDVMQTRMNNLQVEKLNLSANSQRAFEDDKKALENKINELQGLLAKSQSLNNNQSDSELSQLQEEKDSAEAQIEFLNSVIVDMQKKNDDLTSKVQILETGVSLDTNDINLNGIKTAVVAPRLFCDICDMFDLHDTEDCPKQAVSDSPPPMQHNADRKMVRPYCEVCEIFGHDTNECDDIETF